MMIGSLTIRRSAKCAAALVAAFAIVGIAGGLGPSMVTWPSQVQADGGKSSGAFWLVQAIEGSAEVRRAAGLSWTNLAVGQLVEPGSEIRTSSAGRVALVSDRDTLNITPSSRVELRAPVQQVSVQMIYQWFGEVTYEI